LAPAALGTLLDAAGAMTKKIVSSKRKQPITLVRELASIRGGVDAADLDDGDDFRNGPWRGTPLPAGPIL
jgi:hypothetical protein